MLWRWHRLVVALVAGGLLLSSTSPSSPPTRSRSRRAAGSRCSSAFASFTLLTTWKRGPRARPQRADAAAAPVRAPSRSSTSPSIARAKGTRRLPDLGGEGVPLGAAAQPQAQPGAARARVLLTVQTLDVPLCRATQSASSSPTSAAASTGCMLHYGFMEDAGRARGAGRVQAAWLEFDMMDDLVLPRAAQIIVPKSRPGMALWRERLFVASWLCNAATRDELLQDPDRTRRRTRHASWRSELSDPGHYAASKRLSSATSAPRRSGFVRMGWPS